jgi:hypothetical protein
MRNGATDMTPNDAKKPERLIHFAEYMFEWALALDALYLIEGKKGFAIIYLSDKKLKILKQIQLNFKLIFEVTTIYDLLKILTRRLKILEIRKRETKNNKLPLDTDTDHGPEEKSINGPWMHTLDTAWWKNKKTK